MFTADRGAEIHMAGFISLNCRGLSYPGLSMVQYRTTDLPHLEQQLEVSARKDEGTPSKKSVHR